MSAFSNDRGGTVILGIDEAGFQLVPGFDPARVRDALANACNDEMEPPVRCEIDIVDFDGGQLVVAQVSELDPASNHVLSKLAASTTDRSPGVATVTDASPTSRSTCCTPTGDSPTTTGSR